MKCRLKWAYWAVVLWALWACQTTENQENTKIILPIQLTYSGDTIAATVAFYYLENLYDAHNNPSTDDDDFTPNGEKKWTEKRYEQKINHLAEVLDSIGDQDGAELIGLLETENEKVLQDLIKNPLLVDQNYQIIHQDMPDPSGLDLALLYKPVFFTPDLVKNFEVNLPDSSSLKLRPVVLVTGKLRGEEMSFLVFQTPFFPKNEALTEQCTQAYTKQVKVIYNELLRQNSKAKILIMSNLPPNTSYLTWYEIVEITPKINFSEKKLYDPLANLAETGRGTFFHKNDWHMTERLWLSENLVTDTTGLVWKAESAGIFNPIWLQRQKPAKEKGKAWASFTEGKFTDGYSSHFAVFLHLREN